MKKKVYKFFKIGCVPCQNLSNSLGRIQIPDGIEIIPVDIQENKDFAESLGINIVPTLIDENNNMLVGLKKGSVILEFLRNAIGGNVEQTGL